MIETEHLNIIQEVICLAHLVPLSGSMGWFYTQLQEHCESPCSQIFRTHSKQLLTQGETHPPVLNALTCIRIQCNSIEIKTFVFTIGWMIEFKASSFWTFSYSSFLVKAVLKSASAMNYSDWNHRGITVSFFHDSFEWFTTHITVTKAETTAATRFILSFLEREKRFYTGSFSHLTSVSEWWRQPDWDFDHSASLVAKKKIPFFYDLYKLFM